MAGMRLVGIHSQRRTQGQCLSVFPFGTRPVCCRKNVQECSGRPAIVLEICSIGGPNRRSDVTPHHEMDGDGGVWRNGTSVSILSLIITPDTCARLQIDRQWLSSTRGRESWQHRVRKASPRQLWRKGLVDFGDMFRVLPLPKALIVESCLDSPRNDPCSDTWAIYGTKIDALLGFPEIGSIMKQDRHLSFTSFTNPRNSAMAEILYYVVRLYTGSIESEDSQTWLCI
jgi:hypothetical protein